MEELDSNPHHDLNPCFEDIVYVGLQRGRKMYGLGGNSK